MHWKLIEKSKRIQNAGVYSDWKEQIANECHNQCVYCSIHESPWGGIDHYHIDHFRPKSKFSGLTNTITNLYYACPICNKFKSDDWQLEPDDLNTICYPDPSDHNYSDLFILNTVNYTLEGQYISSKFLINQLYLNRPQLVYERREAYLRIKAEALIADATKLIGLCEDNQLIKEAFQIIAKLTQHLHYRSNISPYKLTEIRKSKNK